MKDDLVERLLPCPFCAGEAKTFGPYGWYRHWGISHSCRAFYNGAQELAQGFHSEADAIAAWNTRANATRITDLEAQVERLTRERDAAYERPAEVCEKEAVAFLSPDYAVGQPLSSLSERFACGECATAIRALKDT